MHAGGRFFRNAAPFLHHLVPANGILRCDFLEKILDDLLFVAAARVFDPVVAFFELVAFVDEQRHVAAVIDHELRAFAVRERDRLIGAPPIFFERFALPREDRHAGFRDRGSGVILRGENIAARPADIGAEFDERLDENRRLDGHVQRAGDAHAGERLARGIFFADGHQAGHFLLGDVISLRPQSARVMSRTL